MLPKTKLLIALAAACVMLGFAATANATLTEAQVWKSPAWNVPGLANAGIGKVVINGVQHVIRQAIVQYSGWSPAPLPPPGFVPAVTPGVSTWVRVTGLGTTETGLGYYGLDSSKNESQLRCQTSSMADTYDPVQANPQLVNTVSVQCGVYYHGVGQASWTYLESGTLPAGKMVYRPAESGGPMGYWIAYLSGPIPLNFWIY